MLKRIITIFISGLKKIWMYLQQFLNKHYLKYIIIRLFSAIIYISLFRTLRDDTLLTEFVQNLTIFAIFISFAALCYASASVHKDEIIVRLLRVSGDNFFHSLISIVVAIVFWLALKEIEKNGIYSIQNDIILLPSKLILILCSGLYSIKSIYSFIEGFTLALMYFDIKYDLRGQEKLLTQVKEDEKRIQEVKELLSLSNLEEIKNP